MQTRLNDGMTVDPEIRTGGDHQEEEPVVTTFAQILIAEDDDPLRETLMMLFEQLGFEPFGVATGDQFFQYVEPMILGEHGYWEPDVILTDVNMPGIPPVQVVDGLQRVGRVVPVVIMSGLRDVRVREAVREMGFAWLDKPLEPKELEDTIRCALAESYRKATF